jgi:TolB protein
MGGHCTRLALLAAAAIALLVGVSSAGATPPGTNGRIAFEQLVGGVSQIYTMAPDGTDVTRLTNSTGNDYGPTWSPDGAKVLFASDRAGGRDVYVINVDGTGEQRLTTNGLSDIAVWSPDGSKVAHSQSTGPNGEMDIFTMNPDGSNPVNITNDPSSDDMPSWSPDSARIAFMSYRAGGAAQIYVANANGTGVTQLTTDAEGDNEAPDWSPDGARIAFMSNRDSATLGSAYQIYTMSTNGAGVSRVTSEPVDAELPVWSPDGSKIMFTSQEGDSRSIVVTNADGSGRTVLATGLAGPFPHWQSIRTGYTFSGFFAPIANAPAVNVTLAGRAIPVRFALGGDRGLDIFAVGSPVSQRIACPTTGGVSLVRETTTATRSSLSYDTATGRYRYLWKSDERWAGSCRELVLTLKDGSVRRVTFAFYGDDDHDH